MANLRVLPALLFMVSVFVASASPQLYAYGSWTLPYGFVRIRANSLWDNNNDKAVDAGANAGQTVTARLSTLE
jgi:hypothetical protein